jgi:2-methylcitrate dehydratase
MSTHDSRSAKRPDPDQAMVDIANYVADYYIGSSEAYTTARYMLLDSLACAMLAMRHPECVKHLGPIVPGALLPGGARVPGTPYELDPAQAAYNIGVQIRWLDFNDTWLPPSMCVVSAVDARRTRMTWSRPTRLKLFFSA